MAGYVSKNAAERWNNAARIVSGGGAGSKFVPGMYREPRLVCDDIQPGSYRAIAGATIAPGESGPILITTCDGTLVENAINQTDCTFYAGNRITANVDPCCVIHFTGCGPTELVDCCEKVGFVCFDGTTQSIELNGGSTGWGYVLIPPDKSEWCCDV
jgi:hypothetical protein